MNENWELPLIMNTQLMNKWNLFKKQPVKNRPSYRSSVPLKEAHKHNKQKQMQKQQKDMIQKEQKILKTLKNIQILKVSDKANRIKSKNKPQFTRFTNNNQQKLDLFSVKAYYELEMYMNKYMASISYDEIQPEIQKIQKIIKNGFSSINYYFDDERKLNRIIIIDPCVCIVMYSLVSQLKLQKGQIQSSLIYCKKAQYYALKKKLYIYAAYCLNIQANLYRQQNQLQQGMVCLKQALSLSINNDRQDITQILLQQMGKSYYYSGNIAMGSYYHNMSDHGLSKFQYEALKKEVTPQYMIKSLKQQLFQLNKVIKQPKIEGRQVQMNNFLQYQTLQIYLRQNENVVSSMLKNNKQKKLGQKIKSQIQFTNNLAKIRCSQQKIKKSKSNFQNLPLINNSQVLKSHLSKNRNTTKIDREPHRQLLMKFAQFITNK